MHEEILEFINDNYVNLNLIIDAIPTPIFIKDTMGYYIACNKACLQLLPMEKVDIIGKTVYDLYDKDEADIFHHQDNELFKSEGVQIYETRLSSNEGAVFDLQFHKKTFKNKNGEIAGLIGVVFDITDKKKLESELRSCSITDELTGLYNRREGFSQLEGIHNISERKGHPYCIATIDIDHFKKINDQYGHACGDYVLKFFSFFLKNKLRISDICFRYGGEEFIILLPETGIDEGFIVVERLRNQWERTVLEWSNYSFTSTISVGLSQSSPGVSSKQVLSSSDEAMYKAKNSGRNMTLVYSCN